MLVRISALFAAASVALVAVPAQAEKGPTLLDEEVGDKQPAASSTASAAASAPESSTSTSSSALAATARAVAAPPTKVKKYPWVDLHGYFRFRPDLISNGHLGLAVESEKPQYPVLTSSSLMPPLSQWPQNNGNANPFSKTVGSSRDEDSIVGANMRMRLSPTIHVSKNIRLRLTVDALDNYVMGSAPDYAGALKRPDVPLSAFAMTSKPGVLSVHEAYGEWKTLFGVLRLGRQSSHWGLGLLANGGMGSTWDGSRPIDNYYGGALLPAQGYGYDADFGNFADRAAFVTRIPGLPFYIATFWDFISAGPLAIDPSRNDGVPFDIDDGDDVNQMGLAIFSKPLTPTEQTARRKLLLDDYGTSFDWGLYTVYRTQQLDVQEVDGKSTAEMTIEERKKMSLQPRNAWAFIGDLWLRYENRLSFDKRLIVEAEFATIAGKIEDASPIAELGKAKPKDIMMYGGALKAAFQNEGLGIYLDAGYATGDDTRCFGVYGSGNCSLDTFDGEPNTQITGFKFHRNYRVDQLLFRDIIGAVTNTIYFKPTVSINAHPFYALGDQLGLDLSVMHALAVLPSGTPGDGGTLGTEIAATGFVGSKGQFLASVTFAYVVPGDALRIVGPEGADSPSGGKSTQWLGALESKNPENAWRLLTRLVLMF